MNHKEKPLFYTSFLFLIPLFISIQQKNVSISILIGLVTIFSALHHAFKKPGSEWWWKTKGRSYSQTFLLVTEIILSLILAVWSIITLLKKSQPLLILIALLIFVPSFILYLSTNYKKYVIYHSVWHVAVAIILCLALV